MKGPVRHNLHKPSESNQSELRTDKEEGNPNFFLIFALACLAALGVLSTNIILPAFPDIGRSLDITSKDLTVLISSFFISYAFGQLLIGPVSDRYGRRIFVLAGLAVFLAGSGLCAAATNLVELTTGRIVQGLGACATAVLARAITRDLFDGEELTRALSLIMIVTAAAPGFSPLLGGAISTLTSWRSLFLLVGFLSILLAVHYLIRVGETHPISRRTGVSSAKIFNTYLNLIRNRQFIMPALSVSFIMAGLFTFFATAPAILLGGFGFSPLGLGLFFAATVLVVFAAGGVTPLLARILTPYTASLFGITLALCGSALLFWVESLTMFTVSLSIFLFGVGIVNPLTSAITLQPFALQAGAASALLGFFQMSIAAAAIHIAGTLEFPAQFSLAIILLTTSCTALLIFLLFTQRIHHENPF